MLDINWKNSTYYTYSLVITVDRFRFKNIFYDLILNIFLRSENTYTTRINCTWKSLCIEIILRIF